MGELNKNVMSEADKKALVNRLSRVEGQVRGVKNMLLNDAKCADVLMQISAINAALNSFNKEMLENYFKTTIAEDLKADNYESVEELVNVLKRMLK